MPLRLRPLLSPTLMLALAAPLVWWGAFSPPLTWVLVALGVLIGLSREGGRWADLPALAFAALGLLIVLYSRLPWYPALGLFLRFLLGGVLVTAAVRAITSHHRHRSPFGLAGLALLWLTAPSAPGLFALLSAALLAGEVRHRTLQHRAPTAPRGLWVCLGGLAFLASAGGALQLLRQDGFGYRDAGGSRSPFGGFDFGWPDTTMTAVPPWLNFLTSSSYVLLALLLIFSMAALLLGLAWASRTKLEEWTLRFREVLSPPEPPAVPTSPDGVRRLYDRFLRLAAREGFGRRADETPREFERRLAEWRPAWVADVRTLSDVYQSVRYGELPPGPRLEEATSALARLEGQTSGGRASGGRASGSGTTGGRP